MSDDHDADLGITGIATLVAVGKKHSPVPAGTSSMRNGKPPVFGPLFPGRKKGADQKLDMIKERYYEEILANSREVARSAQD